MNPIFTHWSDADLMRAEEIQTGSFLGLIKAEINARYNQAVFYMTTLAK